LAEARGWAARFVHWYNHEHRHSGIRYVSPAQRHAGQDTNILAARHALYCEARDRLNRRFSERQQMRWAMSGAHYVLLARVEMLDGRLLEHFVHRFPRFRSPELRLQSQPS
jgi:hypothetical protein